MGESAQDVVDYFACQAMHAMLSNGQLTEAVTKMGSQAITYDEALKAIAKRAFDIAAAMMAERGRRRRAEAEFTFKGRDGLVP